MTDLLPPPVVRLLVCGNADRGDDGLAVAAAATLLPAIRPGLAPMLEVRRCPELRTEDLTDLPAGVRALVIDAVLGPTPGEIVRLPLDGLTKPTAFAPRSSHQLPIGMVIGLAGTMRRRPIDGTFLGLAGHRFGYGTPLSRAVRSALPAYRAAIEIELERLAAEASAEIRCTGAGSPAPTPAVDLPPMPPRHARRMP